MVEVNHLLTMKQNYLVVGRADGLGCNKRRQNPASLEFSDRKAGGRILS